jgi:hypothetical protein
MTQLHGTWVLHFHDTQNAIRQLLLLDLCRPSINTVPTSLILLLATVWLMLCSAASLINLFPHIMATRQHRDEGQPGLCMAWQQWIVRNSKSAQSKLCSARYHIQTIFLVWKLEADWPCGKHAVWVPSLCHQPSTLLITNFFLQAD